MDGLLPHALLWRLLELHVDFWWPSTQNCISIAETGSTEGEGQVRMGAEKKKKFKAIFVELQILHFSPVSGMCWECALARANGKAENFISIALSCCFPWQKLIFVFPQSLFYRQLHYTDFFGCFMLIYTGNESTKLYCCSWEVIASSPGVLHTQSLSK